MEDCECEKNRTKEDWVGDNEVGDEFLRIESFNIIDKIKKGLQFNGYNHNAIFNRKLEENEMESIDLDDVSIDYSYIDNKEPTLLTEDQLLEENVMEDEIPASIVDNMLKDREEIETDEDESIIAENILRGKSPVINDRDLDSIFYETEVEDEETEVEDEFDEDAKKIMKEL